MFLSALMILPLLCAYYYQEKSSFNAFIWSVIITFLTGFILQKICPFRNSISNKEGFFIATLGWIFTTAFSTLPFLFTRTIPNYLDAYFECMSGYTATGATILTNIEANPISILFWRNQIQWIGGMGIILLVIALLPMLGVNGMRLFRSEFPGIELDKIKPRMFETAKTIWVIYLFMTVAEITCLYLFGMPLIDAVINTFGTLATGGFNHKNTSIAYYNNVTFEVIIMFFMFLSAVNFGLHYKFFHGDRKIHLKNHEFIFFVTIVMISIILVTLQLRFSVYDSMLSALRYASFQVVSIVTTTGFVTADFDLWPSFSKLMLILLMFMGGCIGSTSGAIKSVRLLLVLKQLRQSVEKLLHPNAVLPPLQLGGGKTVSEDVMQSIKSFFFLYIFVFVIGVLIITATGFDITSAIGAVAATLGGVGPGLGLVGPTQNYAVLSSVGKMTLIICMLLGRLEIYTVLVLLTPEFWRK